MNILDLNPETPDFDEVFEFPLVGYVRVNLHPEEDGTFYLTVDGKSNLPALLEGKFACTMSAKLAAELTVRAYLYKAVAELTESANAFTLTPTA